jgi:hypothetical protein
MDCRDLSTAQGCPAEAADAYARARELLFNFAFSTLLCRVSLRVRVRNFETLYRPYICVKTDKEGEERLILT